MMNRLGRSFLAMLLIAGASRNARGQAKTGDDGSQEQSQIASLGQALSNPANHTVHIIYIHGIGAEKPGASWDFRRRLCKSFLKGCQLPKDPVPKPQRETVGGDEFGKELPSEPYTYMGRVVWDDPAGWKASKPFVDHYVLERDGKRDVVVDEFNWWPLVLPLKCRAIMKGEPYLAGPDKELLELCSGNPPPPRDKYYGPELYPWIPPQDARALENLPARAARFNREVKNSLMDWGFSDPMMSVGPLGTLFRKAMRQMFDLSAQFNPEGSSNDWQQQLKAGTQDREFIVVSHSLGSFLAFSTLQDLPPIRPEDCATSQSGSTQPQSGAAQPTSGANVLAACYILERTSIAYFLANQVPLLQLATLTEDLDKQLESWGKLRKSLGGTTHITAFSDPSDLLSWHLPNLTPAVVENCEVRNTFWHWLIASPLGAHVNYPNNKAVLRIMMDPKRYGAQSCAAPQ